MIRYEFNSKEIEKTKLLLPTLKEKLQELEMQFFVDDKLLFFGQHFDKNDFSTYSNGEKKQSTLRFKEGSIRLPSKRIIPVYETEEFDYGEGPRALVTIDKLIVSQLKELTLSELATDGFESVEHAVKDMNQYYPKINSDSIVSLYFFGKSVFTYSLQ